MKKKFQGVLRFSKSITLFIFLFSSAQNALAQNYAEYYQLIPTDVLQPKPQDLNPAKYLPSGQMVYGIGYRLFSEETMVRVNNNRNLTQKSVGTKEGFGLGVVTDLGGGLGLGVSQQRIFEFVSSVDDRRGRILDETWSYKYTQAKATIQLTENLNAGILIRSLQEEDNVIGNYFINEQEVTRYFSGLFGTGGGIYAKFPNLVNGIDEIAISSTYIPALKGKSEIYGEERILTDPGIATTGIGLKNDQFGMAIRMVRHVHKNEERSDDTVLPNEDQSNISLLGLELRRQYLYPISESHFGFFYQYQKDVSIHFGVQDRILELNLSKDRTPASHVSEDFWQKDRTLKVAGTYEQGRNHFWGGISQSWPKIEWKDENTNRGDFTLSGTRSSIVIGAYTKWE